MSRILVTGANGFVGQAFCNEAIKRGLHVKAATRSACKLPAGAEAAVVGAIDGETDWAEALDGVDVVIHLAARVHVMTERATDSLPEFIRVNRDGTENLAEQAARAGVTRLVYASSIKVNGEKTSSACLPSTSEAEERCAFSESSIPNPHGPYAISKWQAELALQRVARNTGLEIVILRPPLVYGPGVKGNFFSLLNAVKKGIPLPLAGARRARSLIYVGNLVDALIVCATHPAAAGQTYIVSDGDSVSVAALVNRIARALHRPDRSFYFPPGLLRVVGALAGRSDQVDKLFGSLLVSDRKIRSDLSWTPPYSLEQGLRATVDWYIAQRPTIRYNRGSF